MQLVACLAVLVLCVAEAVENCPDVCKCTKQTSPERSEVNCHKKGMRKFPSKLPPDSWILKMGENRIVDLPPNVLKPIPKIESINLERNVIKSIHPQAFSGARRLMLLNLYGNQINKLPLKGFQDLLNLRFLMLGQNQISSVKPDMFTGMRNLSDLDLPLNSLTALPSNAFKPLIALKVLDLALNRIQRISTKGFVGLTELLFLNLDNNSLKSIPAGAFKPLASLEMLVLDNNLLSTLTSATLEGLSNLQELYLRNNELERLPQDLFRHTPKLSQLALSGNRLKTVDGSMFTQLSDRQSYNAPIFISISNHFWRMVMSSWKTGARRLMLLNLYGNQINKLPLKGFQDLLNLRFLMLGQNQISSVKPDMFTGLKEVYLHDNPWTCDCNINNLVRWMSQTKANLSPLESLRCVAPAGYRDKALNSLKDQNLRCRA
ncbi:leucine-rich repeat-containing protein 15-like [Oncorhynchus nerka]|uniref:leucine-rich repeat-containing protein 15-like n=1 Tax=Oncorhynchus nerka TaxID=8023 RepID=UPI001131B849|nr:leucine-rich repeat-containing protein 15-like [Oncorhynchus nerka]